MEPGNRILGGYHQLYPPPPPPPAGRSGCVSDLILSLVVPGYQMCSGLLATSSSALVSSPKHPHARLMTSCCTWYVLWDRWVNPGIRHPCGGFDICAACGGKSALTVHSIHLCWCLCCCDPLSVCCCHLLHYLSSQFWMPAIQNFAGSDLPLQLDSDVAETRHGFAYT